MAKQSIKNLLELNNIKVGKLIKKINISDTMMQSILNGSFGRLSINKAIKIANFFNVEVEDIEWRPME